MFDSIEKAKRLRQVVQEPKESELVQALAEIVSTIEYRQLEAVEDLHDALDIDGVTVEGSQEQRKQQLLDLVGALSDGEFRAWWFDEVVGDHIHNADAAKPYADISEEEWQAQIEKWADLYRQRGGEDLDQHTDQDIARLHVERRFGVSMREFERNVVNYSRKDAMRTMLSGNLEAVEKGIRAAAAEAGADADQDADAESETEGADE